MKKTLFISLFFLQVLSYSQDKNMGGTPVSGIKTIKREASDTMTSKATSNTTTNTILAPSAPTGGSPEVGITEGQLDVSLTGGATYSIPIAVPPGINGVVPQISLAYSSQAGNGMAGYGWNISGVSAISRIPATKFHDGVSDPVDFDNLDRFALDGQRLILKSGTYGANGAEYETENFSNLKITSIGVSPFGANFGPASFVVQYPDGSFAKYGASIDSQTKTEWGITTWQNPQNLVISYNYQQSLNQSLKISSIGYGNTTSSSILNRIQFEYKGRNRPETGYVAGENFVNNSLLSKIYILGNGVVFRNYYLAHDITSLGYERLLSITEKSGDNSKSYNPTVFSYDTTSNFGLFTLQPTVNLNLGTINSETAESVQGDFDGDGKTDLIMYQKLGVNAYNKYWIYKELQGTSTNLGFQHDVGYFTTMFATSFLTGDTTNGYKLMPMQGWNVVANNQATNTTTFTSYSLGTSSNPILLQDVKSYQFPKFVYGYFNECVNGNNNPIAATNNSNTQNKIVDPIGTGPIWIVIDRIIPKEYLNGDFNGDGISDLIVREKSLSYPVQVGCTTINQTYNPGATYFVDLDKRLTSNYVNFSGTVECTPDSKFIVADVNGDGRSDILVFDSGRVIVYTLNENKLLVELFRINDSGVKIDKPILMGDYNGDGKQEFVIPQIDNADVWSFFTSTGTTFVKADIAIGVIYSLPQSGQYYIPNWPALTISTSRFNYLASDFNGDGKTDISLQAVITAEYIAGIWPDFSVKDFPQANSIVVLENKGINAMGNGYYFSRQDGSWDYNGSIGVNPIFALTNHSQPNLNHDYSVIWGNTISTYKCPKDSRQDMMLKKITTGLGVTQAITYQALTDTTIANSDGLVLYKPTTLTENYPNFDIKTAPSFQVVAKVEKQSQNTYKKQLFAYHGAVSNIDGQGFKGFRSLLRTNWFNDNYQVISSVTKHDMALRGANVASYSYLNTSPSFEITPTSYISKSQTTYNSSLSASKVFKIWNTSSVSNNGLDGTSKTTTSVFDIYNNPTSNTSSIYNGGTLDQTETTTIVYDLPLSSPHIIGRPNKKNTSVTHQGSTLTSEELYAYNSNNLLSQIKKKGHLTNYITEDNVYDTFGNITQKTITATPLAPRITKYGYDTSGRFLIKSTDIEGLSTNFVFDANGLLNYETNPYGLKTQYFYDSWYKKIKTTDYLGKSVYNSYSKPSPTHTLIATTSDEGSAGSVKYDDLGREIVSGSKLIDGQWSYTTTEYDDYDRKIKAYDPRPDVNYFGLFTSFTFDGYGRLVKTVEPTTKTTNISYSGLTTTVSDGVKTVITTKNAIGNTMSVTDNGGTINYTYFANGNLKTSNFEGTVISMQYDGWGKKIKLSDPSAGTYLYEYNALGETTKETKPSPKGETVYTLDNFGKITEKRTTSLDNLTNSKTTYSYDGSSKLISTMSYDDYIDNSHTDYTYTYDAAKRIIKTTENNPATALFEKQTTYDDFGRPDRQLYKAIHNADGKKSSKWVKNTYKNGYAWQILDDATSEMLWETNIVNSRGQLVHGKFGNSNYVLNSYDQFGFATEMKYDHFDENLILGGTIGGLVNVMTLNTTFDPIRRNLTSRSNSLYTTTVNTTTVPALEVFKYDNLDRLTSWGAAPETVLDLKFNFSKVLPGDLNAPPPNLELFTPVNGAVLTNNYLSKLNIATTAANSGAERLVLNNAVTGTRLRIKADVNKITTDKIRVVAVEKNTTTGIETLFELGLANEGIFDVNYIVTYSNIDLSLRFVKSPLSTDVGVLKSFKIDNVFIQKLLGETQDYDNKGRITKNNIGDYVYKNSAKQYQNTSVTTTSNANAYYATRPLQNITYNAFKSPVQIREQGIDILDFSYNPFNSRSTMYYGGFIEDKLERKNHKFYDASGTMEIKSTNNGDSIEFITYIGGDAYTAPIVFKSDGDSKEEYLYLYRDYQGSILAITNQAGAVLEKRLFDPWGSIVKVQDVAGNILDGLTILDRGYTGHEHLESVGLINMNGRIYDPKLHRFLQPDNFVQDPSNSQNYNRYGYCYNNPLKYTDINGEWAGWDDLAAMLIGGVMNWATHGCQFNGSGASYFLIGAAAGEASLYGGPFAGAAILGAGNNITDQVVANGWKNIDIGQVGASMGMSLAVAGAGQVLGKFVTPYTNKLASSLFNNVIISEAFSGAVSNGVSGFVLGAAATGAQGGSINDALNSGLDGFKFGFAQGAITGAATGIKKQTVFKAEQALKAQAKATTMENSKGFVEAPIEFQTSSISQAPSRNYTIYEADGTLSKFGVTDADCVRMTQSLKMAGKGAIFKVSDIVPKFQAHINEAYLRSLHFNSTDNWKINNMTYPYPRNFDTGIRISKPLNN